MTIKELAEDIYVEILVGGDRFDKTDIETVIAAHKFNRTELYKLVHDKLEQSLAQPDCAAGKITDEYYVTAMNYWCMSTACYAIHKAMTDKLNEQQIQVCKDIIKFGPYDYASETILGVNHAVYACCSNDVQHGKYKGEQLTGIVSDIAKLNLPIVQVRYDWLGDGKSDMLLFSLTELKCGIRDLNEWARFNS